MHRRLVPLVCLTLVTGCATGAGLAADLPQPRALPTQHPSDDRSGQRTPDDVLIPVVHRA